MSKRGRPKDAELARKRHEEILDMAARVFAKNGFRQTDVQEIADALGLGKGTIYRYFDTKETLFLQAVDRGMQRLQVAIETVRTQHHDPLEGLEAVVRVYLSFFDDNPELIELFMQERAEFKNRTTPTYFQYREADADHWRETTEALIRDGRLRDIPARQIMDITNDLLYGAIFTNYFSARPQPLSTQTAAIVDFILHGILSDRDRQRPQRKKEAT